MHGVSHKHLMNTEKRDQPECVEQQMCSALRASGLIFGGCWPWAHVGPVCIPRYDGPGLPPRPFQKQVLLTVVIPVGTLCNTRYL